MGYWTRGNPEPCLLAIKGKMKPQCHNICNLHYSEIQKHSKKPTEIREKIIQLVGNIPRIELFAREKIEGWDCIGNEIDGKDIKESLDKLI